MIMIIMFNISVCYMILHNTDTLYYHIKLRVT